MVLQLVMMEKETPRSCSRWKCSSVAIARCVKRSIRKGMLLRTIQTETVVSLECNQYCGLNIKDAVQKC